MRPRSFLEQLVGAAVGQISTPSVEAIELETQLLGGEQALSCVLDIRIGRDQRQRGEVVAGDPGGALCVQHVRLVTQPEPETVTLHEVDAQYGRVGELSGAPIQCEHGLEPRLREAQLTSEVVGWGIPVRE